MVRSRPHRFACAIAIHILALLLPGSAVAAEDALAAAFRAPPAASRPWTYWFWIDGQVTAEGITADLEGMRQAGIGGAVIFEVNAGKGLRSLASPAATPFLSDAWRGLWRHAIAEAARLGIAITMHQSPGWCGSGGPWIPQERAAQRILVSETLVSAGGDAPVVLARPANSARSMTWYRDIAVLAMPLPAAETALSAARGVWTGPAGPLALPATLPPPGQAPVHVQISFAAPVPACALEAELVAGPARVEMRVSASDDGAAWTDLGAFLVSGTVARRHPSPAVRFAAGSRRHYRISYEQKAKPGDPAPPPLRITHLALSARSQVADLDRKTLAATGRTSLGFNPADDRIPELPSDFAIDRTRIIDISAAMAPDGTLGWRPPAGTWIVLRIGHGPVGLGPTPVPRHMEGLDCDKLDPASLDLHLDALIGTLIADAGPQAGKALVATHIDSWETGGQNWTPRMPEEFRARRGYDPVPLLAVLGGRVVG
ncbi:MAG: hypothetical protein RLZZ127_3227, partial [Planctomycetota bacterium]